MKYKDVLSVYNGNNGDATKALYAKLDALGPIGVVAVNVFRANKTSAAAKRYRGGIRGQGSYKSMAYDRKSWSLENLARVLDQHAAALSIVWGWKRDARMAGRGDRDAPHAWVLYVELPGYGQVSFHTAGRTVGPDYAGDWDRVRGDSPRRICAWCAALLGNPEPGFMPLQPDIAAGAQQADLDYHIEY